jgi:hypothetical protein
MDADKYDRFTPGDNGQFSNIVRAVIDEICREEPQEAAVQRAVARAVQIPETCSTSSSHSNWIESDAIDQPLETDVGALQRQHSQAVAFLDPQRTIAFARRRRMMSRAAIFAAVAVVLVCVWLGLTHFGMVGPETDAFAETLAQIEKAKTITWKHTVYEHVRSKDGKRTWFLTEVMEDAYKAPGLYRRAWLDDKGQLQMVEITDAVRGRKLTYNVERKMATLQSIAPIPAHEFFDPFSFSRRNLNTANLEWVGTKTTASGKANVFRDRRPTRVGHKPDRGNDLWIDAMTKQLVAVCDPSADVYDPDHDPVRDNPPEASRSGMTMMGGRSHDIRYDVPLDDSLFRTDAPEGYTVEVKPRDRITEKEMIDYVGIVADANGKMFPDGLDGPCICDVINRALDKPRKDYTPPERRLYDTDQRYGVRFGNSLAPIAVFFHEDPDRVVKDSFRYLGKGVKLGDKDRIVCWYKLKDAKDPNTYRVLFGNLTVKDVAPVDLPLPVEP